MPLVELTSEDLKAIDTALMIVNEHVRRGRRKQKDYIECDDDQIGAELMEPAIAEVDAVRITLRGLLTRAKETNDA
jgi:hypothetical protein